MIIVLLMFLAKVDQEKELPYAMLLQRDGAHNRKVTFHAKSRPTGLYAASVGE